MKYATVVIPFGFTPRWGQIVIASLKAHGNAKDFDIILMNNTPERNDIKAISETSLGENVKIHVPEAPRCRWHGGALDEAIGMINTPYMFATETDVTFERDGWLDWYASFMKDDYVAMAGWFWSLGENVPDGRKYINSSATLYNADILGLLQEECQANRDIVHVYGPHNQSRYEHQLTADMVTNHELGPFSESRGFKQAYPPHPVEDSKWWHEPGSWLYNRCSHQWECVKVPGAMVESGEAHAPPHKYNYYGDSENTAYVLHHWGGTVSHNFDKHLVSVHWEADCIEWWLRREYRIWSEVVPQHIKRETIDKGFVRNFDAEFALARSRIHILNIGNVVRVYTCDATPYIMGELPEPNVHANGETATVVGWSHDDGLWIVQFDSQPLGAYNNLREERRKWLASINPSWCVKC